MTRWAPDAAVRLESAALELFESVGYDATTVPQIAAAAGLTTRTYFRHFADKREALFLREREFPSVIAELMSGVPAQTSAGDAARAGLAAAADDLEHWRPSIARRRRVIRAEPRLSERELAKTAELAAAIAHALEQRGEPTFTASTVAGLAAFAFEAGIDRWLADSALTLRTAIDDVWNELSRQLATTASSR